MAPVAILKKNGGATGNGRCTHARAFLDDGVVMTDGLLVMAYVVMAFRDDGLQQTDWFRHRRILSFCSYCCETRPCRPYIVMADTVMAFFYSYDSCGCGYCCGAQHCRSLIYGCGND